MPAARSTIKKSISSVKVLKACTMLADCKWLKPANSCTPEPPGMRVKPWRVLTMISARDFSPAKKWPKLYSERTPNAICALAKPRSASNSRTRLSIICKATAKLMAVVVLPTPPLPLAMPMTSVLSWAMLNTLVGNAHFLGHAGTGHGQFVLHVVDRCLGFMFLWDAQVVQGNVHQLAG